MMKNKLLLFALIVSIAFAFASCTNATTADEANFRGRFERYKTSGYELIYVDTETGCCYLFIKNGNGAGLCQLTDANGYPLIWEE